MGINEERSPGAAVDSEGRPVLDPTKNVLDLVEAAIQRQDDLREAESRHVREVAAIRAEHTKEIRQAESDRINAIRDVDVGNVQRAAEVQAAVAETLRVQVATTANAAAAALTTALDPIQKSIEDLRRAQYEAQGQRTQVGDTAETEASKRSSAGLWIAVAVGASGFILGILGIAVAIIVATSGGG